MNMAKESLEVNHYRNEQDIQESDDEAKCAIAFAFIIFSFVWHL